MLFSLSLISSLTLTLASLALASPPACARDNCLRAVAGTRLVNATATASADCRRLIQTTIFPSTFTFRINVTATTTVGMTKRDIVAPTIPPYASSACTNFAQYSSACSCLGVVGDNITYPATTITLPVTVTTKTIRATPTCTANIKNDPLNCGKCGNTCPSGVCSNGVCSSEICNAQTCGGFTNCNPNNTECFCFSSSVSTVNQDTGITQNLGFCGQNAVCSGLTPCVKTEDCNVKGSTGNICAINTCCGKAGVCLNGQCGNPARKLMRMSLSTAHSGTAAF